MTHAIDLIGFKSIKEEHNHIKEDLDAHKQRLIALPENTVQVLYRD